MSRPLIAAVFIALASPLSAGGPEAVSIHTGSPTPQPPVQTLPGARPVNGITVARGVPHHVPQAWAPASGGADDISAALDTLCGRSEAIPAF